MFVLGGNLNMVMRLWWALSVVALSITHVSVSVANNFVRPQSSADYGYYAYGEVSHLVYCLLQKIKQNSVLPLVEKWEEYMTPNHSQFAAIEEDRFGEGGEYLRQEGVAARLQEVPGGLRELRAFDCCREVVNRPGAKLLLSSRTDWWG